MISLINEIVEILLATGNEAQANWINTRLIKLKNNETACEAAKEIQSIIAGMGSLSDMYLEIPEGVEVSEIEYNREFQQMVIRLDRELITFLKKCSKV